MTTEVFNEILYLTKPQTPYSPELEAAALGYSLGIAHCGQESRKKPITQRERAARRALRENLNNDEARHALATTRWDRERLRYSRAGFELVVIPHALRRMRRHKKHELLLVYRLALIWEWRTGIKPVRTADPEDGRPKDEFYRWAAMQIDKSPLWVFKRHWKNSVLFAALEREQEGLPFYREELKKFCLAASHSPSVPLSSHSVSCHSSGSRSW